ncbi:MAG: PorV/PorQ family protein [Rhodothermales bacterium]|nr:PorV/PorQ family protein [Rhodothermales bacterium]MBO6778468.1 PorV/PorQ family protein [Rhodothermales bacterium]
MSKTHTIARAGLLTLMMGLLAVDAQAQFETTTRSVTKRGTTAADFLNIPVGARATAMGNAVTATIDDATSVYWNPAGLTGLTGGGFVGEYAQWLAGVEFNFVSVVLPMAGGKVAFGVTSMRTPEMEVTTVSSPNGTGEKFDAASYAVAVSYARALTDRFSIGGTVKRINERIWNSGASGTAVDIGTQFVTPFRGIRLGASISNFGSKLQLDGDDLLVRVDIDPVNAGNNESNRAFLRTDTYDLPLTMRIGLAGEIYQAGSTRLTMAVEALNPNSSEQYVNLGAELGLLNDLVMLRGGYSELLLDDAVRALTLGAGLRYRFAPLNFAFDYAWEQQEFFQDVNRLTLSILF